jgi:RHS repeat-associated protein
MEINAQNRRRQMEQFERMKNGNFGRRTYSTGEARFITQVRMEEMLAGEHPYSYALNNPVTYVDPTGEKPQKHGKRCPPGWKLVSVTCYGIADPAHPKSNSDAAYGRNPNCGGCDRKGRPGDCANDTSKGRKGVCGAGQTVTIAYPGNPPVIKAKCVVCDTGQGHNGIDVYVDVPDSDCGKYFNETTYCVKCT